MIVVVDTSVWSLVLRRKRVPPGDPWVGAFDECLRREDSIALLGPIYQEILSGLKDLQSFERLANALSPFPLLDMHRKTYAAAALLTNRCHRQGFQPGAVDALIAAACVEHGCPLLTADRHFLEISRHCELLVLPPLGQGRGAG